MKLTKTQREALRGMFGGLCAYCGQPLGDKWHADHVEPIVRDWYSVRIGHAPKGPDHPDRDHFGNLMPACPPCNIDKHANTLEGWRKKLQRSCEVLARNQPTYRHACRFGMILETGVEIVFFFERAAPSVNVKGSK